MRRVNIAGLCLAAMFAIGAVAASAAQAAPEYFTCVKAAKVRDEATGKKHYTGAYRDKECSEEDAAGEGKYERASAAGVVIKAKGKTLVWSTPGLGLKITCKGSKGGGEITGATTGIYMVELKSCEWEGRPCNSAGAGKGVVRSNPLRTELIEVGEEEAAERITAEGGAEGYQYEYECEGLWYRVKGYMDPVLTEPALEHASKKSTLVFAGEENLRMEVSDDGGLEWIGEEFGGFPSEWNYAIASRNKPTLGVM